MRTLINSDGGRKYPFCVGFNASYPTKLIWALIEVQKMKLLEKFGIKISQNLNESLNIVYVSINSKFVGYIVVSDVIKSEAKEFLKDLKKLNIFYDKQRTLF